VLADWERTSIERLPTRRRARRALDDWRINVVVHLGDGSGRFRQPYDASDHCRRAGCS
jgi:protein-L-isoaspartate O-methyltransferase